ncbi:MAG: restriction endonuclease subunit S [Clostridia bacterium]
MTKKSDAPAIRFKGFSDAWEQRKFSDITFPAGEKNKDNLPLESYSITNEHGFVPQDEKFENGGTMREADKRMYYIVSPNSFAYNPARINVGSIGYQNIGKNVIVSSLYEVFKTSEDVDDRLLWHWFKSPDFQKLIMQLQEGGVRLYFYYDKLCMGEVSLPLLEEQRKIGKLFDTLDNLITLHQRKFEKLTNVKKSMLEKMFPQNGSSNPEIRFKGFTDPWEQRKVSDLAEKTYGGGTPTTSNEAYWNGDIPWIQSSDVVDGKLLGVEPRKWITQDGLNNSAAQLIPGNSIAIITRVGVGKLAFMPYSYATSQDFLSLSKLNAEPLFTVYACYKKLQSELNAVQGTSIKGITKDELLAKNIMVPRYAEQQQIGAFFKQLDHLITLHQRELEKLQNIKKSMLEKMFV